jgi:hypothetical protein
MVLGFSRLIWARFVVHQDLQSVLRCHGAAFAAIGGARREILYDRMKTAMIVEDADGLVVYNRGLIDIARHFGFPAGARPCDRGCNDRTHLPPPCGDRRGHRSRSGRFLSGPARVPARDAQHGTRRGCSRGSRSHWFRVDAACHHRPASHRLQRMARRVR